MKWGPTMRPPVGGGVANTLTEEPVIGQPLGSGSPTIPDSPMSAMHENSDTPTSQGQISPGPSIDQPSNHSPQPHHGHQGQVQQPQHSQQQHQHQPHHLQQHHPHAHQHPVGGYGHVPQATHSPGADMSPSSHQHTHQGAAHGLPPGWNLRHQEQQDIKPPMNQLPAAAHAANTGHGMFPHYSWYQNNQITDNNMNQGLLS